MNSDLYLIRKKEANKLRRRKMAMTLHQALRSLCLKPGWCYAVFWKLKRRSRMVLTWEDGYCDYVKPASASNLSSLPLMIGNHTSIENNGTQERHGGTGAEDQIGLAVAKMSYHVYSLGEGIIGRVAFTGKHQWIFGGGENIHALEASMYPAGWASQFTAGIKTIAVVAVPQGVVQLGSTYIVMEDMNLVGRIRSLFMTLQNGSHTRISNTPEIQSGMLHNVCMPVSLPTFGPTTTPVGTKGSKNLNFAKFGQDSLTEPPGVELSSFWTDSFGFAENGNSSTHYAHQSQFPNGAKASRTHCESSLHHFRTPQFIQSLTSSSSGMATASNSDSGVLGALPLDSTFSSSSLGHSVSDFASSLQFLPVDSISKENLLCLSPFEDFTLPPIISSSTVTRTEEASGNVVDVSDILAANSLYNTKTLPNIKYLLKEEQYNPHIQVLQTNTAQNVTTIATNSQLHVARSDSLKADSFEVAAPTSFGECQGWERFSIDKSTLLSLDEKAAESIIPVKVGGKDSEISFSGVCESFGGSWLGLGALDDIDVFVASLAKDGCTQIDPFLLNPSQHDMCDELSEILAPVYKKGSLPDGIEESDENKFLKTFASSVPLQSCTEKGLNQSLLSSSSLIQETILSETKGEPLLEAIVAGLTHVPKSLYPNSTASSLYQTSSSRPHTLLHNASLRSFDMGLPAADQDEGKISMTHIQSKGLINGGSILSGRTYETDTEASIKLHFKQEITETSSSVQAKGQNKKSQESVVTESLSGKRTEESTKSGRKRVRPGEASRPRPKDRQQIQDRVRELREIVPNGAKCSIDALLERTIKHMHFLQTVTQHGGNWKNGGEKGRQHDSSIIGLEQLDNGASWALELGGQGMGCPIVVENMSQPGQLRVEMMFDEKGLFLEIADTIRGLGLTILKGVMEARNDKIQARFIVEAARDVHRVEVLWSLTQLLQPTTTTSSTVTSQGCLV